MAPHVGFLFFECETQSPIAVHQQLRLSLKIVCVESEVVSPESQDDQSCFEPAFPASGAKGRDSTSHGVNRIHSRFLRASEKDAGPTLSDIEMRVVEFEKKPHEQNIRLSITPISYLSGSGTTCNSNCYNWNRHLLLCFSVNEFDKPCLCFFRRYYSLLLTTLSSFVVSFLSRRFCWLAAIKKYLFRV